MVMFVIIVLITINDDQVALKPPTRIILFPSPSKITCLGDEGFCLGMSISTVIRTLFMSLLVSFELFHIH